MAYRGIYRARAMNVATYLYKTDLNFIICRNLFPGRNPIRMFFLDLS